MFIVEKWMTKNVITVLPHEKSSMLSSSCKDRVSVISRSLKMAS